MKITQIRHLWPEKSGFSLVREHGTEEYVFIHFITPARITLKGHRCEVRPGGCIVYNIGTPQTIQCSQDLIHDWIHFEGAVPALLEEFSLEFNRVYYPVQSEFVTELVREMEMEFFEHSAYYAKLHELKLRELFLKISRRCSAEGEMPRLSQECGQRLNYLRMQMFSNLDQEWPVEKMAAVVNVSPSRFYTLYRTNFGISPNRDLIQARIERAKFLLQTGKYTVAEVAERTGYRSEFHFIRQFRQVCGIPPGKFARNKERL